MWFPSSIVASTATRIRTLTLALVTMVALGLGPDARADINLDFSGGDVTFTENGSGATLTFTGFNITDSSGSQSDGDSSGFLGSLVGSYSYSTTGLNPSSSYQMANLSGSNNPEITITDNEPTAQTLTADVVGGTISTYPPGFGLSGGITGTITLGSITYNGNSVDLLALKTDANANGGSITITFSLSGNQKLTQLASASSTVGAYSGSISANSPIGPLDVAPEPSSLALAGLGALGLIGFGLWRTSTEAAR